MILTLSFAACTRINKIQKHIKILLEKSSFFEIRMSRAFDSFSSYFT